MSLSRYLILCDVGVLLLFGAWLAGFVYGANETAGGNTSDKATIAYSAIIIALNVLFECAVIAV